MTASARTLTQRTAAGVAWTSAFQVARQALQIVSVSVLAHHVPPAGYRVIPKINHPRASSAR